MSRPLGITMGCPAGIGPEIILQYMANKPEVLNETIILGDYSILTKAEEIIKTDIPFHLYTPGKPYKADHLNIYAISDFSVTPHHFGQPDKHCGLASAHYIEKGVELIQQTIISGLVTCPISKAAINSAGYNFPGHTEMLQQLTEAENVVMMMAGDSLRVTLATVHCAFSDVVQSLTSEKIAILISITKKSLEVDFGIKNPKVAVAGLNPHAGEDKLFGDEEVNIIQPAIEQAKSLGYRVYGPFPADTIFYKATKGEYDAIVCMYHDQGLIPFKLLHFEDGVNVTLGLPIVRTSVDHGTAYDIAGKGVADCNSLKAATELAMQIVQNRQNKKI